MKIKRGRVIYQRFIENNEPLTPDKSTGMNMDSTNMTTANTLNAINRYLNFNTDSPIE